MLENRSSEVQWIEFEKKYFSLENDIFLCFAYIAPANSSYCLRHNLDRLSIIEKDVNSFSLMGDVMLCGDTNARVGIKMNLYIMIIHMCRFLNMFYVIIMVNKEEVRIVCAIVKVVSSLICVNLLIC